MLIILKWGGIITKIYAINTEQLNDKVIFEKYYNIMPEQRKLKINKMRFQKDKNLSLGVGIIMYSYLLEKGYDFRNIQFSYSEHEKPYFKNIPDIFFSASHSGNFSVCAFSDFEVGCDIEISDKKNIQIAKRIFTKQEQAIIFQTANPEIQSKSFCRIWTLRESFLKLIGKGLSELNNVEAIVNDNIPKIVYNGECQNLHIRELSFENYCISVCCENGDISENIDFINLDE